MGILILARDAYQLSWSLMYFDSLEKKVKKKQNTKLALSFLENSINLRKYLSIWKNLRFKKTTEKHNRRIKLCVITTKQPWGTQKLEGASTDKSWQK